MVTQDELLRLIDKAAADKRTVLDLSWQQLSVLPPEIGKLTSLQQLDLSGNELSNLPESLGALTNLKQLYLSNNELRNLPESLGTLTDLKQLYLSDNELRNLPKIIGALTSLQQLYLSSNELSNLPESLGALTGLKQLYLHTNQLSDLPESIGALTSLQQLDLNSNQLSDLPESLGALTSLQQLYLNKNKLSSLPKSLDALTSLQQLDLSDNELSDLPEIIDSLTSLQQLDLRANKLNDLPEWAIHLKKLDKLDLRKNPLPIPPEVLGPKEFYAAPSSATEILDFYFSLESQENSPALYEAKLILIGEGGSGKTSLAKKIENEDYQLLKDEPSTEGISIIRWDFPLDDGNTFRTNIWDFGGQEIYHATHQFFLTKRSLYFLVADTRQENTDFYYWLKIVELLSDSSPVIIIKNQKQGRHCDIDEGLLKGQFKNLKDSFPTNLEDNSGLAEIKAAIRYRIQQLPHIGDPLPASWANVRADLEEAVKTQNTLTLQEYFELCRKHGCTDKKRMLSVSSYLHDLGVCLHFQDDKLLKRTLILKPEWATAAVYKVVDSSTVRIKKGRFTDSDLTNIWQDEQYADFRDELLQLMMRFKLAYEIPNTPGNYIAPQLLPISKPSYEWDSSENIILRYNYGFMPKGIISRFIVETHKLINDQDTVWRNGVILADTWAKAEIIENYPKNEINIRVNGTNKKPLLEAIRYELWKIHESYERLEFEELIPCNCSKCKGNPTPEFYSHDLLMYYISNREYEIKCHRSFTQVDVRRLISDITDSLVRKNENNIHPNADSEYEAFLQSHSASNGPTINVNVDTANNSQVTVGNDNTVAQVNVSLDAETKSLAQDLNALLEDFSQDYNPATERGQAKIKDAILAEIQQKPTLRQRATNALKAAGEQALIEVLNHPAAKITIKAIKAALEA